MNIIPEFEKLLSAHDAEGSAIPTHDANYGPVWLHRDSLGVSCLFRTPTRDDAREFCEEELGFTPDDIDPDHRLEILTPQLAAELGITLQTHDLRLSQ